MKVLDFDSFEQFEGHSNIKVSILVLITRSYHAFKKDIIWGEFSRLWALTDKDYQWWPMRQDLSLSDFEFWVRHVTFFIWSILHWLSKHEEIYSPKNHKLNLLIRLRYIGARRNSRRGGLIAAGEKVVYNFLWFVSQS